MFCGTYCKSAEELFETRDPGVPKWITLETEVRMSLEQKAVGTVINCSTFRHRAGNNAKYIRGQIDMFLRVYPCQLEQLRHATKGRDAERLRAAAQTLKGTLGNFAAEPAMRATAALEEKGSHGDLSG